MEHIRSVCSTVADLIGSDYAFRELNCHKLFSTLLQRHAHVQNEVVIPYWEKVDGKLISLGSGRLDCLVYFDKKPVVIELKCVAENCTRTLEHKQQCLKYMRFFPEPVDVVLCTFYNNNRFTVREYKYVDYIENGVS